MGNIWSTHENFVFFDMQTTKSHRPHEEIIQLAAKFRRQKLSEYIQPDNPIPDHSDWGQWIRGHYVENGHLYNYYDDVVCQSTKQEAMENFHKFLRNFNNRLIVIGYDFNLKLICRTIRQLKMENDFRDVIAGFCDALPMFREKLPNRQNYSLEDIAKDFPVNVYASLEPGQINDILEALIKHRKIRITPEEIAARMVTFDTAMKMCES